MSRPHGLSKSRFTAGLQCLRQLWWRVHERDAPELVPDARTQAVFDQGSRVGELARTYVPDGVLVDRPHDDFDGKLAATQAALAAGAPAIYEASFVADGVFVAVDILQREGRAHRVIEVKSATSVKPQHLPDAAVQVHVLRAAGLEVSAAEVMVLNRACTHPDLSNLFTRNDVTREVERLLPVVPAQVREQLDALAGPLPQVAPGPHCEQPYPCPFLARCWPELPQHHVSTLFNAKSLAAKLEAQGITTIDQIPDDVPLNAQAARQRRAVIANRLVVERGLAEALAPFSPPLAHLDFETVMPAVPVWRGCHPYDQVPAQFSVHVEAADGSLAHHAWVADGPGDPRPAIAEQVVRACAGARAVVAYNAPFEKRCLEHLAFAVPEHARGLRDVIARLVDPLPVVRAHVYHPDFGGSFGLKSVLPALVDDLSYDGLAIGHGDLAQLALGRIVFDEGLPADERAALRADLLAYCERDTLATVRVLARLRELAAG